MDKLAINKRTALKMFWDAGATTEQALLEASDMIDKIYQPSEGYWYADDVSKAVEKWLSKSVDKRQCWR